MQVAGAQDHRVELPRLAAREVDRAAVEAVDERQLLHAVRPVVADRPGAVGHRHRAGAHLERLHADVLGGVGGADEQDPLVRQVLGAAEVVGVLDRAGEGVDALEPGHVGEAEVAGGDDDAVELGGGGAARAEVLHGHGEVVLVAVVVHPAHGRGELHLVLDLRPAHAAVDVVPQHFARWVGRDRPAEVLVEGVLGELQGLLRAVRPQVAVHRGVHRLAVLVDPAAPAVVPLAAPVVLLLVADDLGDRGARALRGLEGPQGGDAAGAGSEDGDSLIRQLHSFRPSPASRSSRAETFGGGGASAEGSPRAPGLDTGPSIPRRGGGQCGLRQRDRGARRGAPQGSHHSKRPPCAPRTVGRPSRARSPAGGTEAAIRGQWSA